MTFLREHKIVDNVDGWFEEIEQSVNNSYINIGQAKEYAAMSKDEKYLFDRTAIMLKQLNNKKFANLVSTMVEVFDIAGRLQVSSVNNTEDQAIMDLNRLKAERAIERIIRCIANDQQSILLFAYHLRKNEKASKFTFQVLNGHLQPAILLDIILANNWDEQAKSMQVDLTKPFILVDKQYR